MNCPNCGCQIPKQAKQDAGQKKYIQDTKRALQSIEILQNCSHPELRAACDAEMTRLRIAIGIPRKLWAIYRRADKANGYGKVKTVMEREQPPALMRAA